MEAKGGEGTGLGGSGLQEHSGDGGNKVHWGLPVQDPCQGGPSGQSVVSTTTTTFALQSPAVQPTNTVSHSEKLIITKTLCFVIRLHCSLGERHP